MDNETKNEITNIRNAIGDLYQLIGVLQKQLDETSVLQVAMLATLKAKVPDFEKELDKRVSFAEVLVREQNEAERRKLREALEKWVQ